jgi:predicted Zn-dependent peptidase
LYQQTVLDNGIRILSEYMPHTRSASVRFYVGVGSRYEEDSIAGISHFVEHLLFRGTKKRATSREIAEAIEGIGGILNAETDVELTGYWCKVPAVHFEDSVEVISDILLNSRLDPEDIEKERQVIVEEIRMSYDDPGQRVGQLFNEVMWPRQPLGRDIAGSLASVRGMDRKALTGFVNGYYRPGNMVVSVAGNIEHKQAVATVSRYLGKWRNPGTATGFEPYRKRKGEVLALDRRDTEQVHLCLGLPGLSRLNSRRYTLAMLNVILGEGMSSRLFTEVRDKLGLCYSVHSFLEHFADSGCLAVYAAVDPKNVAVTIKAVLEQLARFRDEPLTEAELARAREQARGRLELRMEDSRAVAGWNGGQEVLSRRVLSVDDIIRRLESVTTSVIQKLASELFRGSKLRLALVGPVEDAKKLEDLLVL